MNYEKVSGFSDEIAADTDTQFKVLQKLGIKYFEPRGVDGKNISELSEAEAKALYEKAQKYGISASQIGSPIGKIRIDEDFEPHFKTFCNSVKVAKILKAKYIRIFSFFGRDNGNAWTEEEKREVLSHLKKMIDYAAEEGVTLLHENEKGIFGESAKECLYLMKELSCDSFGAVFDPANFVQIGQDTKEAFLMLKPYIKYVHIKDAVSGSGKVVPSGMGDGNVSYILKNLLSDGFDGFLSLEPHLGSFEGLENLEMGDLMKNLPEGGEGTFTLAANALDKILKEIM